MTLNKAAENWLQYIQEDEKREGYLEYIEDLALELVKYTQRIEMENVRTEYTIRERLQTKVIG